MSFKFTTLRLLLAFAILPFFTQAEEWFFPWNYSSTASSHVLSLGNSFVGTPTIDGVPIVPGDWIGVFYTDDCGEHCGGAIEWTGENVAVVAFGDDMQTTPWVKDGFAIMEVFIWKIYSQADNQTYDAVATYTGSGQDFYMPTGFSYLTDLAGASPAWAVRNVLGQVLDDNGAWMENVAVTFDNSGGSAATDEHGYYCKELPTEWAGTATPSKSGYSFVPVDITYTDILNSPRNQDYVGTFTGTYYTISGNINDGVDPIENVEVDFPGVGVVYTDASGDYSQSVPEGWSGTVTPTLVCYTFAPLNIAYSNVTSDQTDQDYVGTIDGPFIISGTITDGVDPLENVEVVFTGIGSVFTNASGFYTVTVTCGYSGTATPSLFGYSFNPPTRTYTDVSADFAAEDYVGSMFGPYAISGTITDGVDAIEGIEVVFGVLGSAFTDASGFYTYDVPFGWSGTATPGSQCYVFDPLSRTYTDVDAAIPDEDYTGTVSGTATISGVITDGGTPVAGIDVVFDGVGTAVTNGLGEYSQEVPCGWAGNSTPTSDCYTFIPTLRSFSSVTGDIAGEDYNATLLGPYTISGTITDGVDPISNVAVDFEGIGSVFTDIDGDYSQEVPCGWSGDVTPISDCYTFAPEFITFTDVIADYSDQDFTGIDLGPYTISGYVTSIATGIGMENVEVVFSGIGSVYTDASGYYFESVPCAWNGSVTPFLLSWAFNPPSRAYTYVTSDLTDQDFTGTQDTYTISGYVTDGVNGIEGAQVVFDNGGGTSITDASGFYEQEVWAGYTGTATPYWDDYYFDPPNRLYASLDGDLIDQDYVGALSTLPPGWSFTITGTSHIISIPLSCNPNIDGIPLTPGDYIGVFFDDGGTMVCGGAVKWTGVSSVALIAYGDDLTTTDKDGFAFGETFNWKVYSWTAGEDYDAIATYDPALPQHDGTFVPDGLSALLALDATGNTYTVSGTITLDGLPLEGVTIAFSNAGGFTETDASGFYSKTLLTNWDGVATPAKTGHNFTPENRTYAPLAANWTDQDYTAALNMYIISGMVAEAGTGDPIYNVTIFLDNGGGTTHTLSTGYYSIGVLYGWTGTAFPSKDDYNFDPVNRPYISVSADLPDQDYVGEEQVWPPGWEFEITSTSHIISVPLESLPNINGVPLLAGDFVGVFFYDSLGIAHCGGAALWTGIDPVAVTAYGDDNTTDEKDGFYVGEDFEWRVYSSYVGEEYDAVVTYDPALPQSDGKFYVNGLSALLSLNATSTTMFTISGTILDSETSLGVEGVDVTYSNGGGVATTDAAGLYSLDVLFGWSGTTSPYKVRYQFVPEYYDYFQVMEDHVDDYTAIWEVIPPGWEVTPTGTSHTISVPLAALPRIDGVPLEAGDFVGVFFYDPVSGTEICGGYAEWDAVNPVAVVAYGDDLTTTDKDGFDFGENFRWKVFSWIEYAEHEAIAVYDPTMPQYDGTFFFDGLSALLDLYADPLMVVASATPDIICYDGFTQLEAVATGGSGFYTYSWTPTDNLDDPTIANPVASNLLTTTTFNVVVNTFVNSAEDNVEVTVYDEFLASIAADQIICYNTLPEELTSTVSGGQGNYTYQWQVYDTDWVDIEGATDATYQPGALTVTTLYRLVVTEFCGTVTTNEVTITVYGEFLASIAADQIICYNTVPELLTSTVTGGEGTYTYQWEKKEGDLWVYIADANDPTYQPPALTISMMYRLFVTDLCGAITTDSVTITVYDEFLASIAADQVICYNIIPEELTSTVSGGEGTYTYQWQEFVGGAFVDIVDATTSTYQPGALLETTAYRLVVTDYCGVIETNSVTITVYDEFLASIAADQIICHNTAPELLTSTVTGGEGTYTYQWEMNEGGTWAYIADAHGPTYQPPALTISKMYRLFVTDLCGAITTDSITITVYPEFVVSIAADQVICEGTTPEELTSIVSGGEGTYTYQWQIDTTGVFEDIAGANAATYQPGNLYGVTLYQLVVTDYCGTIISDTVSITFYESLAASIAADQTICVNTAPDELTSTVTGGQGNYDYQWQLYAMDSTLVENCYGLDDFAGNYYSNSLIDAGWTTYDVVEDVLIDSWSLNIGTLTADSWPSEIALWAKSPAGTAVNLYTPPSSGTFYDLVITTTDFDGEMSAGVWEIWFEDSYGDGGATAYTNSMCIGFISVGAWVDISGAIASTYQPPILTDMMMYRLEVTDFCGIIYSNEVTIDVIQLPVAYAGEDDEICADEVYVLQGDATDYSTVLWTTAGDGTFDDASLLNATYFAGPDDLDAGFADLTLTAFAIDPCTEFDEDYVTIFFAPLPTVNAGDDAMICEDDFFMTMGWTTNAYGILWTTSGDGYFDNPQSTAALYFPGANDLSTGFVELTLTANPTPPCTQQVSDVMELSFGYLPTAYAGEDATVCGLESYPLEGEATEYSTVLWTTSGDGIFDDAGSLTALYTPGDDDIANGSATLTLTVYAKAPCTGEAVDDMVLTIIPLPEADAGPDATACEGDGYELSGASANNYGDVSWETSGTGTFDDPHIIHPVYTASSGDIANGSVVLSLLATALPPCPGDAYDEMTLSFSLIPTADAGEDDAICEGEVYVLAGVATDYTATEWTTGGDGTFDDPALLGATYTPGPFDLLAGTVDLTLTAFAASPCPDDAVDVMTLMIAMTPSADAGLDDKICEDETYTLNGQADNYDMIIWTTSGDGTFDNNTLLDATYHPGTNDIILGYADLTLTAYPISPCAFAASDVMTLSIDRLPDVPGTPNGPIEVCAIPVGDTTHYTTTGSPNALSYYWEIFPEDAGTIEGEGTTGIVTWSGDYIGPVFIKVQGINDCGAGEFSDPIEVYADDCTGLPEDLNAQLNINVYPNPSDGIFNIEVSGATGMMELYILDYKGQLIHQDKIENGSGDYLKKLDISTYPKGIYFLKLVGDNVMRIEKIVIR